jgi:hypothetical protein
MLSTLCDVTVKSLNEGEIALYSTNLLTVLIAQDNFGAHITI